MMICRAKTDQLAVGRRFAVRCCRLPATYRYFAAVCIACLICAAHLVVEQTFLPAAQATVKYQPSTDDDDDALMTDTPTRLGDHAFHWTTSRDTGCDDITGNNFDDADRVVCGLSFTGKSVMHFHQTFELSIVQPRVAMTVADDDTTYNASFLSFILNIPRHPNYSV